MGSAVAEWVRALACTGDRTVRDGLESHCRQLRFGTSEIPFTPLCQCLSEETLKSIGPLYLVSMLGEVNVPISPHWNVLLSWTPPPTLKKLPNLQSAIMRRKTLYLVSEETHSNTTCKPPNHTTTIHGDTPTHQHPVGVVRYNAVS